MKTEISRGELAERIIVALMVTLTVGIAAKFLTFLFILNENLAQGNILTSLFFPYFPNVLDSTFLIVSVVVLALLYVKERRR